MLLLLSNYRLTKTKTKQTKTLGSFLLVHQFVSCKGSSHLLIGCKFNQPMFRPSQESFMNHWKLFWDFQGDLLGERLNKLPWFCGVMEGSNKSLSYEAVKESDSSPYPYK